ncbi:MAG: hypothetical protein JNM21_08895 [Taibaiella sp.]|nr:hypothetical protein [Taibaiella sp.]
MAQINIRDKKYLIKIIKAKAFQLWTLGVSFIMSILILKDRFALLFLVILLISNLKGMLLLFKRNFNFGGKDLVKALEPHRSIQLPERDLDAVTELVRFHLIAEPDPYFLVVMPGNAIFHQERPFVLSILCSNRFYCLEANENGTKVSTFSKEIPFLFRALKPELAIE